MGERRKVGSHDLSLAQDQSLAREYDPELSACPEHLKSGISNKRLAVCLSLGCTGILSIIFSLSPIIFKSIPLAFTLIVLIGFSNSIYVIAVMSAIQIYVDDNFRARIVGVFVLSFSFMSLGSLWVGFMGGLIDDIFSVEKIGVLVALSFGGVVLLTVGILVYLFNNSLKKVS